MRGRLLALLASACAFLFTSAHALTIKSQPKSISVNAGSTATFSVVTTNGSPTGYQWMLGTTPLQDGTTTNDAIISGSQTDILTIENVGTNLNAKLFKVAISNSAAPVLSVAAKLTVLQGTLVKFDTSEGPIVVELFDHDKPVTVQNFLRYTSGGGYVNSFFTRLEPNFVLQGGGYAVYATSTNDVFTNEFNIPDVYYVSTFNSQPALPGYVVNESHVGPHVRNTSGTLAMATISGFPDTARSEFFFNLADNSSGATNLDNSNGGYAVFGRVVQGSDVLQSFNNLPSGQILSYNVPDGYGSLGPKTFPTLPTKTTDSGNVHVGDLFFTSISLLGRPHYDLIRPTGKVTFPAANAKLTNGDFTLRGVATDNVGISSVICTRAVYFSIGPDPLSDDYTRIINVTGTTNWSAEMHLHPGPWSFTFRIIDGFGNWSQITENLTVMDPLTVATAGAGSGKVLPNYNGQFLSPETKYSMTAVPNKGQLFAYWSAERNGQPWDFPFGTWGYINVQTNGTNISVLSGPSLGYHVTTPVLNFVMYSNLTITATFVSNYFPVVQGTYYGLMAPTDHDNVTVSNSGLVKIMSTALGTFSGTLTMQGKALPFGGKWDYSGTATNVKIPLTRTTALMMNLSIDLSNNLQSITGTVAGPDWTSDVNASRAVTKLTTNSTPPPGSYVMKIPSQTPDLGDSYATMTASATGMLTFSGMMADNTPWTESVGVAQDGSFPIFSSLYTGRGLVIGWQQFASPTNALGETRWIRPAISNAFYTNGFTTSGYDSFITAYKRPATNTTYVLRMWGNTLSETDYGLKINSAGKFVVTNGGGPGDKLVVTLVPTTGAVSGTWTDPALGTWTIKGVLGTFDNPGIAGNGFILGPHGQAGFMQLVFGP